MSVDSENSFLLPTPQDSRTSCIFQATEERDEAPGGGEESVLEMLSFSKFSDLETWLCMPSSLLLPGPLESTHTSSSSSSSSSSSHAPGLSSRPVSCSSSSLPTSDSRRSTYSEPAEGDAAFRRHVSHSERLRQPERVKTVKLKALMAFKLTITLTSQSFVLDSLQVSGLPDISKGDAITGHTPCPSSLLHPFFHRARLSDLSCRTPKAGSTSGSGGGWPPVQVASTGTLQDLQQPPAVTHG
ncbi:hypothetical protein fugu_000442 [Takifugu bimaculatus]|uniref:Uncharacterized protein n=1 Tax=Takifugu bimaculatus TaxID=433685 RepID=A0A4Z2CGP9_9TELE|nr:hypothetical protein fugu_000442 [Takifugu bimaculatus]